MTKPNRFHQTKIGLDVHHMIVNLEESVRAVAAAKTPSQKDDAYAVLCYARMFLYEYLSDQLNIGYREPFTLLRFN